jgi:hypothetical protein
VLELAQQQGYGDETRTAILQHLSCNADGTFLWVALVCQNLNNIEPWDILKTLKEFPPGLNSLYLRMLEQIRSSKYASLCERLLATMVSLYRPVALIELLSLVEMPETSKDIAPMTRMVGLCGSFLIIRDNTVYFVHQSAKDFLLDSASDRIFPRGQGAVHYTITTGSLYALGSTLQRDIYNLQAPGYSIEQVRRPDPDPLAAVRYACVYWVDHLCDWLSADYANLSNNLNHDSNIQAFFKEQYLYWLEALSLYRSISEGVLSIARLYGLIQVIMTSRTPTRLA